MKKLIRTSVCMVALSFGVPAVMPLFASTAPLTQDRDDHDRDRRDDSAYQNNKYFKQGWNDGMHHKHKHKKFKNDEDRRAYEAGFMHGDRNEQWQDHDRNRDHDHDHDHR